MTIGGQTFTVTQAASGSSAYFDLEPFAVPSTVIDGRFIDFDSDGDLDFVARQFNPNFAAIPVLAFRNDGQGHYTNATAQVIVGNPQNESEDVSGPFVADFNGDGRMDLFWPDGGEDQPPFAGGQSRILIQSADGHLVDETVARLPQIKALTHSVTLGDIDGDGDTDIFG